MTCRVLRIDEQLYGCEELPAGQPVLCDVLLADAAGTQWVLPYPDEALTAQNIQEGDTVALRTAPSVAYRHNHHHALPERS